MNQSITPFIIGVAGGTGSGKTYVAKRLQTADPKHVIIISHDHYYKDQSHIPLAERKNVNYDEPAALDNELFLAHLAQLKSGQAVDIPQYDFSDHTRKSDTAHIAPSPVIIVEGILILTDARVRAMLDLTLFVEVDADIRLARRLERDVGERDRTFQESINQYLVSAQPMYDKYVEPGKDEADLVINNNGTVAELEDAIETVQARIKEVLGRCQ